MNRTYSVIVRACRELAVRSGAWIIGLAMIWMAAAPRAAWAQWNGTNPVWTNSNVGIGTASPTVSLDIQASGAIQYLTSTTGTNRVYQRHENGGGNLYTGIESSTGSTLIVNAPPYSAVLG